jgi:hypothetical protein
MKSRLYAVRAIVGAEERNYLVDAASINTAKAHVSKKHIEGEIADGKTVARLMDKGVKMESAVAEPGSGQQTAIE